MTKQFKIVELEGRIERMETNVARLEELMRLQHSINIQLVEQLGLQPGGKQDNAPGDKVSGLILPDRLTN